MWECLDCSAATSAARYQLSAREDRSQGAIEVRRIEQISANRGTPLSGVSHSEEVLELDKKLALGLTVVYSAAIIF
jgi:hypothetical protein